MSISWKVPFTLIITVLMLITLMPAGPASAETAPTVIFSTDFENIGLFISAWEPLGWSRGDYAAGHEDDQWCRANADAYQVLSNAVGYPLSAHSSASALYGAKIGTNAANGVGNLVNGYPDPGMDSWVRYTPPNATRYDGMTLTFYYWARTASADFSGELTDLLRVNVNDGTSVSTVWSQPSPDSQGWQEATVYLPTGTLWMEWEFKTGPTPAGGPYPGVFIDDVTVTAGRVIPGPPASHVSGMSAYYSSRTVQVPVAISDANHLALYYQADGGAWTKYVDSGHPDGRFTSGPIAFQAPGDGRYGFFTIAGNSTGEEGMKSGAEASTFIDTAAPTVVITAPGPGSTHNGEVALRWTASDDGSGLARTEVRIDSGSWMTRTGTEYDIGMLPNGQHSASVRATDNAGNTREISVSFLADEAAPEVVTSPTGQNVPLNSAVVASFSKPMDPSSVHVIIFGVHGTESWNDGAITFTPSAGLAYNTTYTVTVTGRTSTGIAASATWSFTTVVGEGNISGTVRDPEGGVMANAMVSLSNGASTSTDSKGHFMFADLPPGNYTLTITKEGYQTMVREVVVTPDQAGDIGTLNTRANVPEADHSLLIITVLVIASVAGLGAIVLLGRRPSR